MPRPCVYAYAGRMDALAGLLAGPRAHGAFLLKVVMKPPWSLRIEDEAPLCSSDPVDSGTPQPGSDFWPGQVSRTHVGVAGHGYRQVMAGLRAGRVWVDHGQLIDGIDVRLYRENCRRGRGATLGGRLTVRRGERLTLAPAHTPCTSRSARPGSRSTCACAAATAAATAPACSAPPSTRTARSPTVRATATRGRTPGATPIRSSWTCAKVRSMHAQQISMNMNWWWTAHPAAH